MSFLDTVPAAIQRLDGRGPWARFRVTDARQRMALLREIVRGDVPLTLGAAGGPTCPSLLWALDDEPQRLHIRVAPEVAREQLQAVLGGGRIWAAGYLQAAKVQFELRELVPGPVSELRMLQAGMPAQMVHLPRRRALRVRRSEAQAPTVTFRHPQLSELPEQLRVADISMTGCGLWRPSVAPPLPPGTQLRAVEVALDPEVFIVADMEVAHLTPAGRVRGGLRVGCDWRRMSPDAAETLQQWIARGRRRRDLVSLSFD